MTDLLENVPGEVLLPHGRLRKTVQHRELLQELAHQADLRGQRLETIYCAVSNNQHDISCLFRCVPKAGAHPTIAETLGVDHSVGGHKRTKVYHGLASPLLTTTMAFPFPKKQTIHMPLIQTLSEALNTWERRSREMPQVLQELRTSMVVWDSLLLRTTREGICPWSRVQEADQTVDGLKQVTAYGALELLLEVVHRSPELRRLDLSCRLFHLVRLSRKAQGE